MKRDSLFSQSRFRSVPAANVGPTVMSGRVTDIAVHPKDPTVFYVAYASGGLWRTVNNGQSFEPIFDHEATMTIGAIAVVFGETRGADVIWLGTGESNSSRSSYAGDGIYVSRDGGATWKNVGLTDSHHIGEILVSPDDTESVLVAAVGHLYSGNAERGVFRSTDGGANWERVLFVDDNTGAIALRMEPGNPEVIYAAMWERERRAWNFVESGNGSGIYKSRDGGKNWKKISGKGSGLPDGAGMGRIGLAISNAAPSTLYALIDNQNRRPAEKEDEEAEDTLTRDALRSMTRDAFLKLDKNLVEEYLTSNGFPEKYDYDTVAVMVRNRTIEPVALVDYVEDANQQLFDTPVIGAELYRSDDAGQSWTRTHTEFIDGLYNSYGYYFGEVAVSPQNVDRVYIMGVPLLASSDGGKTFDSIGGPSVHADHHVLWVSPSREGHLINGNDGGLNISYDNGENWYKANSPEVGQFYAIQVDNARPYNVYGGLQDNGVWYGPSNYSASSRWHASGEYPWKAIAGGDGMQVEVDTRSNDLVYTGSQFGFYSRYDLDSGDRISIRPRHDLGERPLRFNWQTPVHLSRHQQDVLYIGANRLYRSLNQGEDLKPISGDLTNGGRQGDVPYGTLATIDESPLQFGLLYTGSDDGLIYVSKDGGVAWTRVSDSLPRDLWVSRVEASAHLTSRVYVSLNGYRSDDFASYVFASDDYGKNWSRIGRDLPVEPVNVVLEDPSNEDVLFVGTDHGLYVSVDRGNHFEGVSSDMPRVAVHDLKIQEREGDLLVGTHGRSIYRIDLEYIRALAGRRGEAPLYVFEIPDVNYSEQWGTRRTIYSATFEPDVDFVVSSTAMGPVRFAISADDDTVLKEWTVELDRGLNYLSYDLTIDPAKLPTKRKANPYSDWTSADDGHTYLRPGTYVVNAIGQDGTEATTKLVVKERSRGGRQGAAASEACVESDADACN